MRKPMLRAMLAATFLTGAALSAPAYAGNPEGHFQVKVLGSAVLPNGKIDTIKSLDTSTTLGGALAGMDAVGTKANDNAVPTLAVEYFFNKTFSVETICCFTQHHVSGTKDLAGTDLVDHVLILPATLTLKAHLDTGGPIKPYIGAGPALFFVFGTKPGDTAQALGIDRVKMSDKLGFALQGGVDIAVGHKGFGVSLDAKKYWVRPTASFYQDSVLALKTRHDLDPWVLSGGVTYRF